MGPLQVGGVISPAKWQGKLAGALLSASRATILLSYTPFPVSLVANRENICIMCALIVLSQSFLDTPREHGQYCHKARMRPETEPRDSGMGFNT